MVGNGGDGVTTKILVSVPFGPRLEVVTVLSVFKMDREGLFVDFFFASGTNQVLNLNRARRIVLQNGYDYMFIVESDIILPVDSLLALLKVGADICVGLYKIRKTEHYVHQINGEFIQFGKHFYQNTGDIEVSRFGLGCCLIKRRVLEEISFRTCEGTDVVFSDECRKGGFKAFCNCQVRCGHIDQDGSVYGAL